MKLYTEEQIEIAMAYVHAYHESDTRLEDGEILKKLTPIEIPSVEEIRKESHNYFIRGQLGFEAAADTEKAFLKGAKLVLDKIQGGNK